MSRIEAVITDFGGVLTSPLLDSFVSATEASGISLEELGKAMAAVADRDGVNPLVELETGRITEGEFFARLSDQLSDQRGSRVELDGFGDLWFRQLEPNQALIAYMRELGQRGYKLAICTNNVREWEARWRAMVPIDEIFDVVVDSAFVGTRKPEARIYRITLERLGATPEATLFIDDTEINCDGARELGMTAIRFRRTEQVINEVEAALAAE
jgi:putative hydrolase of the HAD superfamily